MSYTFRKVTNNNIGDVARAFNKTRGTQKPASYFQAKFKSPIDAEYIGCLVYDENNEPVTHAGIIPRMMNYEGERFVVGMCIDTVTVVEHQRRGLFKAATEYVIEEAAKAGLQLLFRFPNPNTYKGLMKHLNFDHTTDFYLFNIKTACIFPMVKVLNKFSLWKLRHLYFRFICNLPWYRTKRDMKNSVDAEGYAGVVHDKGFFEHKEFSENYLIRIGSDRIWFRAGDGILIGDMEVENYDVFMEGLRRFCLLAGIHQVKFIVVEGTNAYIRLQKYTTPQKNLPVCIKDISGKSYDLKKIKFSFADHDDF